MKQRPQISLCIFTNNLWSLQKLHKQNLSKKYIPSLECIWSCKYNAKVGIHIHKICQMHQVWIISQYELV